MYEYSGRLIRVVDADTWIVDVSLGFNIWVRGERIRAASLNAPEMSTDAGKAAKAWVEHWFTQHTPDGTFIIRTQRDRNDNYGRLLGTITAPDGAVLNADLLATGHAEPWPRASKETAGA